MLHAGIINGLKSARLAAVADPATTATGALREICPGIRTYTDYRHMLDDQPLDAVVITSPTGLHVPMCLECTDRGLPFLVEKPLATSATQARPLLERLRERPVVHLVGYMGRFLETFRKGRDLIASGVLGRPLHFRATMYVSQLFARGRGWRYDPKQSGGGVVITQNSHLIDQLCWYFGPVAWVSAHTKGPFSRTVEDFAHAVLGFECGLTGYFDASWSVRHHRMVDITIHVDAENGTLTVTDDAVRLFLDSPAGDLPAGWTEWRSPDLFTGVEIDVGGPQYTRQDAAFLDAVAARRSVEPDAPQAYHVQQVVDAIYASAAERGRCVEIEQ